jgi:hypothetical protein
MEIYKNNFPSPQPMPPKADPYATPMHRRINLLLLIISVAIIAILLLSGSHGQAANSAVLPQKKALINAQSE